MSVFDGPICVASNGNTLYSISTSGHGEKEVVILAQSNTAPDSLDALTWTAIAATYQKPLTVLPGNSMSNSMVTCHVDNRGVFTLFSTDSKYDPSSGPITSNRPSGYQYNPATKTWTNLAASAEYIWAQGMNSALFTVDGSSNTLMHIYKGIPLTLDNSAIAVYNPKTQMMTEGGTPWVSQGTVGQYTGANGTVYITSNDAGAGVVYLNIGTVAANGAPPVSPKVVPLNVSDCMITGDKFRTTVREGTYYLFCGDKAQSTYRWFTYDGTAFSASSPTIYNIISISGSHGFLPLGPAGRPPTWALMYDDIHLQGVPLTGPEAGTLWTAYYKFNISGSIPNPGTGNDFGPPNPGNGSGAGPGNGSGANGGNEGGSKSGGLSTGTLAGIIGGVVVVLGVAMFALWRRKRSSPKPVQLEQQPRKELPPLPVSVPVEQYQKEDAYQYQKEDPYPESALPMAPTVFAPQDAINYYPPPTAAAFVQTNFSSPTASSPQVPSPGNPSSLSPHSFTNSTLTDSEITTIAGSPYHNASTLASTSLQQYPQPQNPAALPIDQRAPQMYPAVTAPQFYGEHSQAPSVPSNLHSPALQMYPVVTAPQFYGEPSQAYPPPPLVPTVAAPQDYGPPSQAYLPPPVSQSHATPEHCGPQDRNEYA